jgi:predicted O-methyltransferase YrrM
MNKMAALREYLHYYFTSRTRYGVHSPFVYDFICQAINKKTKRLDVQNIESLRKELKKDKRKIPVTDYGAGSHKSNHQERCICEIAKHSAKNKKYATLLYRIVNYFKPSVVLELGTSVGITTCYLAQANSLAKVVTIEGCPEISQIAQSGAQRLNLNNIEFVTGNFDNTLDKMMEKHHPEFIFFDGNHSEEATIRYFEICLNYVSSGSVFIFDDINWSEGMKEAWKRIKSHPKVTVSIDLYFMGIVFFRKELSKEDFIIRF